MSDYSGTIHYLLEISCIWNYKVDLIYPLTVLKEAAIISMKGNYSLYFY